MKRPQLNRHLFLEELTQAPDGSGGYLKNWSVLGDHWAEIKAGTGRETAAPGTAISRVTYKITVRAAPMSSDARPKAGQRFRGQGRLYTINAVAEVGTEGRYLTCHAIEENVT